MPSLAHAHTSLLAARVRFRRRTRRRGSQVRDGDLKNIVGTVQTISQTGSIVVMPTSTEGLFKKGQFKDGLAFEAEQLQKWFKMGDHVKVTGGTRHVGETGLIVQVGRSGEGSSSDGKRGDLDQLHIFSDLTQAEIVVPAYYVQECSDVSSGLETLGQYALHDLVTLDRTQAAVIIKVEHSSFRLLTTANEEVQVPLSQMGRKKSSRGVPALDVNGKRLEANSPVVILDGPKKDKSVIVKHIFKSFLFVHDVKDTKERAGIYCARARQVALADAASNAPSMQGFDATSGADSNPHGMAQPAMGGGRFVPQSPSHLGGGGGGVGFGGGGAMGGDGGGFDGGRGDGGKGGGKGGGRGGGRGRGRGADYRIGKAVRMTRGSWKGYHGTVKTVSEKMALVELHGKQKSVNVPLDALFLMESMDAGGGGATAAAASGGGGGGGAYGGGGAWSGMGGGWSDQDGSRTPSHDGHMRTPLRADGFRTPMHEDSFYGSRTPMHDGSRTPMHDSAFGAPGTPMHDGSRTPLHESAWDPSSRTPAHRPVTPDAGGNSAFDGGFGTEWNSMGGAAGLGSSLQGSASPFHGIGGSGSLGSFDAGGYGSMAGGFGGGFGSNPFAAGADANPLAGFDASPFDQSTPGGSAAGGNASAAGLSSTTWTPTTPSGSSVGGGSTAASASATPMGVAAEPPLPENIQVKLVDGRKGTITEVRSGPTYMVTLSDGGGTVSASRDELDVVRPAKKDKLIILKGDLAGSTGTLIGIDGADGIVKMVSNSDIKILDLDFCARLADGLLG